MNQVQEIIVYRNPGEKAMWDVLMSGDAFPVIAAVVVGFIVLACADSVIGKSVRRYVGFKNEGNVYLVLSAIAAVATWWWLRV